MEINRKHRKERENRRRRVRPDDVTFVNRAQKTYNKYAFKIQSTLNAWVWPAKYNSDE